MGGARLSLHHILILAAIQGLTEFLPVSSSGHLVITSKLLGFPDQGLTIDVALHVGTLAAVMLYFWRDVWEIAVGVWRMVTGRGGPQVRLLINVIVATIPIIVAGYFARPYILIFARDIQLIAWTSIGFAALLYLADRVGMTVWRIEHLTWLNSIAIGLAQTLALIPGTSRSGITMTAGRLMGMERAEAARFSLLLSIPTIIAAGLLTGIEIRLENDFSVLSRDALVSAGAGFVAGFVAIALMMAWLRRAGFTPFVVYRLILGGGLLYWLYNTGA